jgi:tetratricopeptide (TPR) repeat protein
MAVRKIVIATLIAACAMPASASVVVLGSSDARLCFEAADSPMLPQVREVRHCDDALNAGGLTNSDSVATHVNRGILLLRRNQIDAAIADFDLAMQLDPNQPEVYLNKGAALIRRQNPGEAAQLFTVALEHNTQRPAVAHYGRAVAYEALGNVREAYQEYRTASELEPGWSAPRADLQRFRVVQR